MQKQMQNLTLNGKVGRDENFGQNKEVNYSLFC